MKTKKTNIARLMIAISFLLCMCCIHVFAYTGILDTFHGWDYTNAGNYSVNTFSLTDNDVYVKVSMDDAQRWLGGGDSGMYIAICKKNIFGNWVVEKTKSFTVSANDTSSRILSYTSISKGVKRLRFAAYYTDKIAFTGVVYDDK